MAVTLGACQLHLTEHHGDCSPGSALRIPTDELDAYHARLTEKPYRYVRPAIELMPWGSRDMSLRDPFGNRLTFTEHVVGAAPLPGLTRP
jgi:hypothetical protein